MTMIINTISNGSNNTCTPELASKSKLLEGSYFGKKLHMIMRYFSHPLSTPSDKSNLTKWSRSHKNPKNRNRLNKQVYIYIK